jgi:hypothetical protein
MRRILLTLAAVLTVAAPAAEASHRDPRADFTVTPGQAQTGQTVTFDASASRCYGSGGWSASNCTSYTWQDDADANDPLDSPYALGTGRVLSRSFQSAGTKYVWLTVQDAAGRQTQTATDVSVTAASPPPPPPPPADRDGDGVPDSSDQCPDVPAQTSNGCPAPPPADRDGDGFLDGADLCPDTPGQAPDGCPAPVPPPPSGCDRNATPSTFASQVSAATAGQTICLESGAYGTWSGTNKAITIRNAAGATPTMRYSFGSGDRGFTLDGLSGMGGSINGAADITVKNSAFSGCANFGGSNTGVVFDGNAHNNINATCGNSRLGLGGSGVTIQNSLMQGGDADGAFIASDGVRVIGNRFIGLCHGSTGNHTDGLQFADPGDASGGYDAVVRGNYFADTLNCGLQSLSSYDSGTQGALIEDNVVDTHRPWGIEIYSDQGSIIRHNTVRWYPDSDCVFNGQECGQIDITRKTHDPVGTGTVVVDNVATRITARNSSTLAERHHNLVRSGAAAGDLTGVPAFVGPLSSRSGYLLAQGSPGENAASDGLDIGIR